MTTELSEQEHEAIAAYEMPKPRLGQQVIWWQNGVRDASTPMIGGVLQINHRSVMILLPTGKTLDATRHVDDPKLELNVHTREDGAWDFTDQDKELNTLVGRVITLERQLSKLTTKAAAASDKKKPPKKKTGPKVLPPALERLNSLKKQAKDRGITVPKGIKADELELLLNVTPQPPAEE